MCLAVPMKVVEIEEGLGRVELAGVERKANLELLREVNVGDYVIIHAGFAIQKLDEKEAEKTLSAIGEMKEAL